MEGMQFVVDTPEWKAVYKMSYRGRESIERFMAIVDSSVYLKFKKLFELEKIEPLKSLEDVEKVVKKIKKEKKVPKHLLPLLYRAVLESATKLKLGLSPKEIKNIIMKG